MKIEIKNAVYPRKVEALDLKLGSVDTHMKLLTKPLDYPPAPNIYEYRDEAVIIDFEDSYQLDVFIDALLKFRAKNREYMGKWQVTLDDVRGGFQ